MYNLIFQFFKWMVEDPQDLEDTGSVSVFR